MAFGNEKFDESLAYAGNGSEIHGDFFRRPARGPQRSARVPEEMSDFTLETQSNRVTKGRQPV